VTCVIVPKRDANERGVQPDAWLQREYVAATGVVIFGAGMLIGRQRQRPAAPAVGVKTKASLEPHASARAYGNPQHQCVQSWRASALAGLAGPVGDRGYSGT